MADDALGQLVERLTVSHHRRRLRDVGWTGAIDATPGGWAEGDPPPRAGNAVEVLIEGPMRFMRWPWASRKPDRTFTSPAGTARRPLP